MVDAAALVEQLAERLELVGGVQWGAANVLGGAQGSRLGRGHDQPGQHEIVGVRVCCLGDAAIAQIAAAQAASLAAGHAVFAGPHAIAHVGDQEQVLHHPAVRVDRCRHGADVLGAALGLAHVVRGPYEVAETELATGSGGGGFTGLRRLLEC